MVTEEVVERAAMAVAAFEAVATTVTATDLERAELAPVPAVVAAAEGLLLPETMATGTAAAGRTAQVASPKKAQQRGLEVEKHRSSRERRRRTHTSLVRHSATQ